jgi:hypothetical protein
MRISLAPETAERIRGVLGDDIDLAPDLIPSVLGRLAVEAPAIYSQVLTEISGSQIRLDSEDELRRRRRRGLVRRLLFSWGEYETDVGDRLIAKRHIAAAVPLGIATLTMTLLLLTLLFGHKTSPSDSGRPAVAQPQPRGRGVLEQSIPLVMPPRPASVYHAAGGSERAPWPKIPASHASSAAFVPIPPLPPFPETRGNVAGAPGNPIVVTPPARLSGDVARGPALEGPVAPIVYNRSTDAAGPGSSPAGAESRAPEVSGAATDDSLTASPVHRPWSPGARVPGRLVSGVVLVPGGPPVPVVAETETPRGIWLGQATLAPGNRVQVTVQLAAQDRTELVRALALDPDQLTPGLTGRTSMRRPAVAAAAATAALQAAADYAQTVLQQGGLGNFGGWTQFPGVQAAPAWTYFVSRLAQAVEPTTTAGALLATTEIPAGAPLILLVLGAQ